MQLEPREYFTIARGLEDHTDSTTYYVRAVIRNAKTDEVIDTVDLVDNGNRRFTYSWQVPADPSGLGFYILVTTTVYTDSNYTTKADIYGEKFEEHLVQRRPNPDFHSGPGGADVSYKKIREIVAEELAKLPPYPEMPAMPDMPNMAFYIQPVLNAIAGLRNDIQGIELPETDFSGIEYRLETLQKAIEAIHIPESDLSPVLRAISDAREALKPALDGPTQVMRQTAGELLPALEKLNQSLEGFTTTVQNVPFVSLQLPKQQSASEQINYDELLKQ